MAKRHLDRSTLRIHGARRTLKGIEVSARFEAPKTSGEVGLYSAQITIDPTSRGIVSIHMDLRNRARGGLVLQNIRSKDSQWDLARDVVDVFLKTEAWKVLSVREPDFHYIVDESGQLMKRGRNAENEGD